MSKGTILVVDADEDIRKMLDVYFSELGYEVKTFSNRDGMLEIAEHESPDVVLLAVHHLILSVSEANFVTN